MTPAHDRALWDAVLFFEPGAEWRDRPPVPTRWINQTDFYGEQAAGKPTGEFFRDDCRNPPIESDWFIQVGEAMHDMRR